MLHYRRPSIKALTPFVEPRHIPFVIDAFAALPKELTERDAAPPRRREHARRGAERLARGGPNRWIGWALQESLRYLPSGDLA